jgi:hypothetical protein
VLGVAINAALSSVQSIFSAIMEDDGQVLSNPLNRPALSSVQSGADFDDLNPQTVDVHTILPRIPALKVYRFALCGWPC